jgi:hypothetical protein
VLLLAIALAEGGAASGQAAAQAKENPFAPAEATRVIDDSGAGVRWVLLRNSKRPGGPGRLIPIGIANDGVETPQWNPRARLDTREIPQKLRRVILGGDPLIVEDHAGHAETRVEAVALGPAAVGQVFKARLKVDNATVNAIALSSGHATLAPPTEAPR